MLAIAIALLNLATALLELLELLPL